LFEKEKPEEDMGTAGTPHTREADRVTMILHFTIVMVVDMRGGTEEGIEGDIVEMTVCKLPCIQISTIVPLVSMKLGIAKAMG
jgi:sulfopyruvate decarboxylase TPP-binding subunit